MNSETKPAKQKIESELKKSVRYFIGQVAGMFSFAVIPALVFFNKKREVKNNVSQYI